MDVLDAGPVGFGVLDEAHSIRLHWSCDEKVCFVCLVGARTRHAIISIAEDVNKSYMQCEAFRQILVKQSNAFRALCTADEPLFKIGQLGSDDPAISVESATVKGIFNDDILEELDELATTLATLFQPGVKMAKAAIARAQLAESTG